MKQKDIIVILLMLFVFVTVWIGSNIYHNVVRSTISITTSQDMSFIAPTFDTKAIDKLKQRQKINPSFELESIVPTPGPTLPPELFAPQDASSESKLRL